MCILCMCVRVCVCVHVYMCVRVQTHLNELLSSVRMCCPAVHVIRPPLWLTGLIAFVHGRLRAYRPADGRRAAG